MEQFTLKRSSGKYVVLLIGSLGFVAAGIFLLFHSPDKWVGWMGIILFGSSSLVFIWQILDSRPRLIINDQGVFDRTLGVGVIPWSEIADAYPMRIASSDFVCLVLRQPEAYANRLPQRRRLFSNLNRQLGFTDFSLNLTGIEIDPAELCELILKRAHLNQKPVA